ncbi:MAG: TIR domain-containing protein [Betaproteobacteria bacterium]
MSIEVFISYRRSDAAGHARALHRALLEFFEVERIFFDRETIEGGDNFPERIRNGVLECKVLLVLIAPGWLIAQDESGRRRLDDPSDFVRNEIAFAFETSKVIIPLVFDGGAIPRRDELPEVLARLSECDMHQLAGKNYEYDAQLKALIYRIAKVAGITPPQPQRARARSANGIAQPEKLAYLCDRSPHEADVRDTIRGQLMQSTGSRRPFVLVVHGPVEELHYAFVERLAEFCLPRVLRSGANASVIKFLTIHQPVPVDHGQATFNARLRDAIGEQLQADVAGDGDIIELVQNGKLAAMVAVLKWRSSELAKGADLPLQKLLEYWASFPAIPGRALIGCIVCMQYDMSEANSSTGWLKRLVSRGTDQNAALRAAVHATADSYAQDARVMWRVLPELPPVTVADLGRWVDEIEQFIGRLRVTEEQLQRIVGGKAKSMETVLPELRNLIELH